MTIVFHSSFTRLLLVDRHLLLAGEHLSDRGRNSCDLRGGGTPLWICNVAMGYKEDGVELVSAHIERQNNREKKKQKELVSTHGLGPDLRGVASVSEYTERERGVGRKGWQARGS